MDTKTRVGLFGKNESIKENPASITKILTCIIALERGNLDDVFTIPKVTKAGSIAGVKPGEIMTLRDMLYGMMLHSANDLAGAIAIGISGSIPAFLDEMNSFASRLGVRSSHFTSPSCLPAKDHYSSAYDIALITCYALQNSLFREIISTPVYVCKSSIREYIFENTNALIHQKEGSRDRKYPFCLGGKTGSTPGQCCLVSVAEKNELENIVVQLAVADEDGTHKGLRHRFQDAVLLHEWAFNHQRH